MNVDLAWLPNPSEHPQIIDIYILPNNSDAFHEERKYRGASKTESLHHL